MMSFLDCPDCQAKINHQALTCPYCGKWMVTQKSLSILPNDEILLAEILEAEYQNRMIEVKFTAIFSPGPVCAAVTISAPCWLEYSSATEITRVKYRNDAVIIAAIRLKEWREEMLIDGMNIGALLTEYPLRV